MKENVKLQKNVVLENSKYVTKWQTWGFTYYERIYFFDFFSTIF